MLWTNRQTDRHKQTESNVVPKPTDRVGVGNKLDRYTGLANTYIFYPVTIETASTWHDMAMELIQEIGSRITVIIEGTRETTF